MKQAKSKTTLMERDALQDMLDIEKLLTSHYAYALTEGSSKAFRKEILNCLGEHEQTQFAVFEAMLVRGYYETPIASKEQVKKPYEEFTKALKQIQSAKEA